MSSLRSNIFRHRRLAALLVAAALLMKLLVPTGFMPEISGGKMVVQLCTGQGAQTVMIDIPGKVGEHEQSEHKKADMPCAFAGLSSPSLAATDPILLVIAVAFIIATVFLAAPLPISRRGLYLRPPSQGPPAII